MRLLEGIFVRSVSIASGTAHGTRALDINYGKVPISLNG